MKKAFLLALFVVAIGNVAQALRFRGGADIVKDSGSHGVEFGDHNIEKAAQEFERQCREEGKAMADNDSRLVVFDARFLKNDEANRLSFANLFDRFFNFFNVSTSCNK